jgi:hypothetical protein
MNYAIECRRVHTRGHWLFLGNHRCDLATAKCVAQDTATELQRETRVVNYGKTFRIFAEFSALGQPLRPE